MSIRTDLSKLAGILSTGTDGQSLTRTATGYQFTTLSESDITDLQSYLLDTTDTFTGVLTVTGSAAIDNITIDGNTLTTTDVNGNLTITPNGTGEVIISSNLTVSGTTTTVNSNEVNIADAIITLNSDEAGTPSADAGLEIERGTSTNARFLFEEASDLWKVDPGTGTLSEVLTTLSTIDADTLDGIDSTGFALASHVHDTADITTGTFADARIAATNVTQHVAAIDHDALLNFVANEHLDWSADQGATNLHVNNITAAGVTQHQAALSITESQISDLQSYLLDTTDTFTGVLTVTGSAAIDNITIDGNAITSTDVNGNITLTPNGTGNLVLDGLNWPQADGTAAFVLQTDGAGQLSFVEAPGLADWSRKTNANTGETIVSGQRYLADTITAAFTLNLPAAPADGDEIWIWPDTNTYETNNLTIGRNTKTIDGVAADFIINTNGFSTKFIYNSTAGDWRVYWISTLAGGDIPAAEVQLAIDDLSDVDTTTVAPVADDLLIYDGSKWAPSVLSESQISDLQNYLLDTTDTFTGVLTVTGSTAIDNITIDGNTISSTDTNGNILLTPNGTGEVRVGATNRVLTVADEGTGNGIDADTVDGLEASAFSLTSHNHTLDGLSNTTITTIAAGEVLKWDGAAWINNTLAEAGAAATSHVHDTADITTGTFADARIAATNVTQHQAALSITESQISDLQAYLLDTTDTFTGVLTVTGSAAIDNITIDGNAITSTDVNGNITLTPNGTGEVIISSNLTVSGTTTTVNSNEVNIADSIITLNSDEAGTPSQNAGIEIERGTSANVSVLWNETTDLWEITDTAGTFEILSVNSSIDKLSDVVITTPATNELLTYNGTNWVNQAASQTGVNLEDDNVAVLTSATTMNFTETGTADFVVVADATGGEGTITFNTTDVAIFDNMTTTAAATNDLFVYNGTAFAPSTALNGVSLQNYSEVVYSASTAGPTYNIDLANGNVQEITLTGNVTFDIIGEAAAGNSSNLVLFIVQDATGGRTSTFPGSVTWTAGGAPTLDTTASGVEILSFFTIDGGTIHYGSHIDSIQPDLADLNDVTVTTPADNDILAYDTTSGEWINQTAADAGISSTSHTHTSADVTDFNEAAQDAFGTAVAAGTQTNITVTYDDANNKVDYDATHDQNSHSDTVITTPANGELLTYNGTNWVNQAASQTGVNLEDDNVAVVSSATTMNFTETGTADFVVVADATGGEGTITFNTTDVAIFDNMTTTAAATNDLFVYNGTAFAPSTALNGVSLQNYSEVVYSASTAGPTYNIDLANGNVQEITLTGNVTFDIIGEAAAGNSSNLVLFIVQDATGGRTSTFPGTVTWTAGGAPTLDTTASGVEILSFFTIDGGTIHYGSHIDSIQPDLADLNDVTVTTPADNDLLAYDTTSSEWINQTAADAGIAAASHVHDTADVTTGTFADARIAATNVTQHVAAIDHDALLNFVANEHLDWSADQGATNLHVNNITAAGVTQHEAALTITESQISDLQSYLLDTTDTFTGVLTVTGSAAIDNITIDGNAITSTDTNGNITLTPNGTGEVIISSNLTVNGTTTTVNSNEVNIGDNIIVLNSDEAGVPSQNAGIEIERGTSANVQFLWNETTDAWEADGNRVLTTADEGTGNGLDADTLDGIEGASYLRSDTSDSYTSGTLSFASGTNLKLLDGAALYHEHIANNVGFIPFPEGGAYKFDGTATGVIELTLPTATYQADDMITFHVDIVEYYGGESFSMQINGYTSDGTGGAGKWSTAGCITQCTDPNKDYTVRFRGTGTNQTVCIGETTSTFYYPTVVVRDVTVGYTSIVDDWAKNWSVTITNSPAGTVWQTVTSNLPLASDADTLDGLSSSSFLRDIGDTFTGNLIGDGTAFIATNGTQFLGDDGTLAAPSFAFLNASNTGMFMPVTDQVGMVAGGVEQVRIDSANVTLTNDLIVSGGGITLSGTGRIQGIDSMLAATDAVNKTYVDSNFLQDTTDTFTGTLTVVGASNIDNITIDGNAITSTDVNGDITITPNGTGNLVLDGLNWPQADGTADYVLKTNGAGQLSFAEATGGLNAWTRKTNTNNNDVLVVGERYLVDTTTAAFTLVLPVAPADGDEIWIWPDANTYVTNNLTLGRNGKTIDGAASDFIADVDGFSTKLIYNSTAGDWRLYWISTLAGGDIPAAYAEQAIDDMSDVDTTTVAPVTGDVLEFDGTNWVPAAPSGGSVWVLKTGAYTAENGDRILTDSNTAAFTITLPASPTLGYEVEILDGAGYCATNNVTVAVASGDKLIGVTDDTYVINQNDVWVTFIYMNAARGWVVKF